MEKIVKQQREFFYTNQTKNPAFVERSLIRLLRVMDQNEPLLYEALKQDLNKSETESYLAEVQIVKAEIKSNLKHLRRRKKTKRVRTPITHFPGTSHVYRDPYGVVLILSPWNYPFQLAMAPLVGEIGRAHV